MMVDRIDEAFAAFEQVDVPVSWDDVVARDTDPTVVADTRAVPERRAPRRRRVAISLVAALVVTALVVVIAVRVNDPADAPGVSATGASVPNSSAMTPTTQPATRSTRTLPVAVWTGDRYLVWGGEAGLDERSARADGWMYDPATATTTDVPTAPIVPGYGPVGVWTGEELIVCCGAAIGAGPEYDTRTAAAYRPADRTWRRLADPPAGAGRPYGTAVWTGDQMIVVFGRIEQPLFGGDNGAPRAFAYDPAADAWRRLADPPASLARLPEAVWTGGEVIVWSGQHGQVDRGYQYDPTTDAWTTLPELPVGGQTSWGSIAWVNGQVVVYGADADEDSRSTGARWRPGDAAWRAMSDPGLPPIDWYEGTPGSQILAADTEAGRIVVWPVQGSDAFDQDRPLLAYDPSRDTWTTVASVKLGYHSQLVIGDRSILRPDRDQPVVDTITPSK